MSECIFCTLPHSKSDAVIEENEHFYAVYDLYPVSRGHCLIISKKHFENIFDLPHDHGASLLDLVGRVKKMVDEKHAPAGYNVTANVGRAGGQTVFHIHVHLIPRYAGDSLKPEAGGPHKRE